MKQCKILVHIWLGKKRDLIFSIKNLRLKVLRNLEYQDKVISQRNILKLVEGGA